MTKRALPAPKLGAIRAAGANGGGKCAVGPGFYAVDSGGIRGTPRMSRVLVVPSHHALLFALPVAFLARFALVVRLLALGERDFGLDLVAFPVERGGHQGVAVALDATDEVVDLGPMQQQLARAAIVGHHVGRGG